MDPTKLDLIDEICRLREENDTLMMALRNAIVHEPPHPDFIKAMQVYEHLKKTHWGMNND